MLIPIPSASVQKALEQQGSQKLAGRPEQRLVRAAHEFEAQLMKEILKPLAAGNQDSEQGGGVLADFAGEALGRAISDRGGLGIASRLVADLAKEPAQGSPAVQIRGGGDQ